MMNNSILTDAESGMSHAAIEALMAMPGQAVEDVSGDGLVAEIAAGDAWLPPADIIDFPDRRTEA